MKILSPLSNGQNKESCQNREYCYCTALICGLCNLRKLCPTEKEEINAVDCLQESNTDVPVTETTELLGTTDFFT